MKILFLIPRGSKRNTILIRENMPKELKVSERVNDQGNQTFIKAFNKFKK